MQPLPNFPFIDTDSLKKAINGFVLCKLTQYPNNPAWTFTSSFGSTFEWRGATIEFTSWTANVNRDTPTTSGRKHISGWLREDRGCSAELQQAIINEGLNYVYIHRSGHGGDWGACPLLTVSEYDAYVNSLDATQQASAQPIVAFAG